MGWGKQWMDVGGRRGPIYSELREEASSSERRQMKGSGGKGREAERREAKTRKSAKARAKRQGKGQPSEVVAHELYLNTAVCAKGQPNETAARRVQKHTLPHGTANCSKHSPSAQANAQIQSKTRLAGSCEPFVAACTLTRPEEEKDNHVGQGLPELERVAW